MTNQEKILELSEKLIALSNRQEIFQREINDLRIQIRGLINDSLINETHSKIEDSLAEVKSTQSITPVIKPETINVTPAPIPTPNSEQRDTNESIQNRNKEKFREKKNVKKSDFEKFIGENLINKIGIVILLFGVVVGAKYSIENNLISPLTRIILGYFAGLGLFGAAIKLKEKYHKFSAVLLSGSMASLYFITYFGYSLYDLFPQTIAFGLMVIFTVFTVFFANKYDEKVIAHIGLVGAYAIPFLLSNNSGNILFLFTYMAIINIGILVVSFKKNWKSLYYASFAFTWLIFIAWTIKDYAFDTHFGLAFSFATIFYLIFYATFISYKIIKKEQFDTFNVILMFVNSFTYFLIGYYLINNEFEYNYSGFFAVFNGLIHFCVAIFLRKKVLVDHYLLSIIIGFVLIFITIAIPIQLDGSPVTLLWTLEALLLFWLGRVKKISIYETLSYPLMLLATFSWLGDLSGYHQYGSSFMNRRFLISFIYVVAFSAIYYIKNMYKTLVHHQKNIIAIFNFLHPVILLGASYILFFNELTEYFYLAYKNSRVYNNEGELQTMNLAIKSFRFIWICNYTILYLFVLGMLNITKLKNHRLGILNIALILITILISLTFANSSLMSLAEYYFNPIENDVFPRGIYYILIRYISYGFIAMSVYTLYRYNKSTFMEIDLKKHFEVTFATILLWCLSNELINQLTNFGMESHKLELSILWGVFALILVIYGIWKNKKHMRLGAMGLFGLTLVKLFLYDISSLSTIAKTIVFVSLGLLLLIISFLYNKYKNKISDEK